MDKTTYQSEALKHLSDTRIYERLNQDPSKSLADKINRFVKRIHEEKFIDNTTMRFLTLDIDQVRTQVIYFLPKIHKDPLKYRPIVSCCSGATENLSLYLDNILNPIARQKSSY